MQQATSLINQEFSPPVLEERGPDWKNNGPIILPDAIERPLKPSDKEIVEDKNALPGNNEV